LFEVLGHGRLLKTLVLPFFQPSVSAGFPSPGDDHFEQPLDLKGLLVKHPEATFFVRAAGDSMIGAGIHSGDILVVDRALNVVAGKIVIAVINGEMTVKRLGASKKPGAVLLPENPNYKKIEVSEDSDLKIWGVVTSVIHMV
jgi:DNA polymerase V